MPHFSGRFHYLFLVEGGTGECGLTLKVNWTAANLRPPEENLAAQSINRNCCTLLLTGYCILSGQR
jgi:hypothetical protein